MRKILIVAMTALFLLAVCLPAPAQAGAKGRANTAIIIGGTALALSILGFGGGRGEPEPQTQQVIVVRPDTAAYPNQQQPPGRWMTVPGQWIGGRWVPSHQVWVPVNP